MILVTLGTHPSPMVRLVKPLVLVAKLMPEFGPFVIQQGVTPVPLGWSGARSMDRQALSSAIGVARIVITHGGPATIAEARSAGKIPVVVPRRHEFGEHVDDHQVRYAMHLAAAGEIILVDDVGRLPDFVRNYQERAGRMAAPTAVDPGLAVERFRAIVADLQSQS